MREKRLEIAMVLVSIATLWLHFTGYFTIGRHSTLQGRALGKSVSDFAGVQVCGDASCE
jgi:hypothetical protein